MRKLARIERLEGRVLYASTHFAVIGDFGNDSQNEADVAAMVKGWNPDYIVTVGDNSYPTASATTIDPNIGKYYHDYIYHYTGTYGAGSPTRRFFPAMGNHDWGNVNPGSSTVYTNYFDLPGNERYYDFVQGPVHFFVIDSDTNEPDGTSPDSVQGQWLKGKLAAATEPHKVIMFHHPAYTSGTAHRSNLWMRWPFAKWGATAVFTGHEHSYERLSEEGISYFVNGLGGAELAGVGTPIAGSQFRYNADYGAMLVDADDASMTTKFYRRNGTLIDSYTINIANTSNLIQSGADWNYFAQGTAPPAAWKSVDFNDVWSHGPAQLGYGDADEATILPFGNNANSKYITTYLRKTFNVSSPASITGLDLSMLRDDGAIVYLNGTQVFSSNMPTTGTIGYATLASSAISGEDEGNWYSTTINPSLLVSGSNVIAVELHQSTANSTDLGFDLSLKAKLETVAPLVNASSFQIGDRPMSVEFTFSENVSGSLTEDQIIAKNLNTSVTLDPSLISVGYNIGSNVATIRFPGLPGGVLPDGNWRVSFVPGAVTDAAGNPLSGPAEALFFVLGGDANQDRKVDIKDLYILASNWQQTQRPFSQGDFTGDGIVDALDLGVFSSHWQGSLPELAPFAASTALASSSRARPTRLVSTIMA